MQRPILKCEKSRSFEIIFQALCLG